jgi:two-component system, NarL family, invasion response regulator UvrY
MIQVIIIDDHPIIREGLKRILSNNEIVVSGEADNGAQAIQLVKTVPCNVAVLDIILPDMDGFDVLRKLHLESPRVPALVLSMHSEVEYGLPALYAGAAGYLSKNNSANKLVQAIRKVARGGKYISPQLAEELLLDLGRKGTLKQLSNRELQIVQMIGSGKTASVIAKELHLSIKTVSTFRLRALEKLRLKNNAEVVRYAIKQGLVA